MPKRSSQAPELKHIRVRDCMHPGIFSCHPDAPLGEVAGIMAQHHVHAVAVTNGERNRPLRIVSALDVVAALASGQEPTAREAAATETISVSANEPLAGAAQLMIEHGVSHLVVRDAASGYPVGVLSTLDIAAVYADGPRRPG
jgi:predicted transcriptional regulator